MIETATAVEQHLHNIRTPLNTISLTAELGKLRIAQGESGERLEEIMERILTQCARCADQIKELEEFLTIDSNC